MAQKNTLILMLCLMAPMYASTSRSIAGVYIDGNSKIEPAEPGIITEMHCSFLGHGNARLKYRKIYQQALSEFGVENAHNIVLKKMNAVSSYLPWNLFTWVGGTWIRENAFDKYSNNEQIFCLYHEAAHYVMQDYLVRAGLLAGTICGASLIYYFHRTTNIGKMGAAVTAASLTGTLPYIAKKYEKEADIKAVYKLVEVGQRDVVENYIKELQDRTQKNDSSFFFHSDEDRIAYMTLALSEITTA